MVSIGEQALIEALGLSLLWWQDCGLLNHPNLVGVWGGGD